MYDAIHTQAGFQDIDFKLWFHRYVWIAISGRNEFLYVVDAFVCVPGAFTRRGFWVLGTYELFVGILSSQEQQLMSKKVQYFIGFLIY